MTTTRPCLSRLLTQLGAAALLSFLGASAAQAAHAQAAKPVGKTPMKRMAGAEVLKATTAEDWREPSLEHTLYMDTAAGRVIIELAPAFAPLHVQNILDLVEDGYFKSSAVLRVHENYVVQWGAPEDEDAKQVKGLKKAKAEIADGELFIKPHAGTHITPLPDGDAFAPVAGMAGGFPAAADPKVGQTWLTHCYSMVGIGRGEAANSGNGSSMYVVIGQAPRNLDRNVAVVGRVLQGMEWLTSLPRGTGDLGFYTDAKQQQPIQIRRAIDVPEAERVALQVLRTERPAYLNWLQAKRFPASSWYLQDPGRVELCSALPPVRKKPT